MLNESTRASRRKQHEQATTIERIWNHVVAPHEAPITPSEHDYYARLKEVYAIMREHRERHVQVALIEQLEEVVTGTCYRLIRDCESLFGRLVQRGKELDKAIHCERLLKEADAALEDGDRVTWRFLMSDYAEIRNFKEDESGLSPGDVQLPTPIWASDTELLKEANGAGDDAT